MSGTVSGTEKSGTVKSVRLKNASESCGLVFEAATANRFCSSCPLERASKLEVGGGGCILESGGEPRAGEEWVQEIGWGAPSGGGLSSGRG